MQTGGGTQQMNPVRSGMQTAGSGSTEIRMEQQSATILMRTDIYLPIL